MAGSTKFTVTNIGSEAATVLMSITTCTGNISSCTVSPAGGYLGVGASMPITAGWTGGATPSTGSTIEVTVKNSTDNNYLGAASASVTLVAQPNAPTVSTAPHLGDRRDASQCMADCFESTLAYTTPAYISLDVPRSLTLLYRSGRAYPQGKVTLDVSDPNAPAGSSFRLKLKDPNGAYLTIGKNTQELYFQRNPSGSTRIVAQFVATGIPTSANMYTAEVTSVYPAGVQGTTSVPVRIIVINDVNSPFGAGVDIAGFQRLFVQSQAGAVLITDGSGSASFFSGGCSPSATCTFTSPSGDFSTLTAGSNLYKRTYPDGSVVTFNSSGNQLSTKSRFGDSTYVQYGTLATGAVVPNTFTDPVGSSIVLWWRYAGTGYGIYKEQTLGQINLPTGATMPFGVNLSGEMWLWLEVGGTAYRYRTNYDTLHRLIGVQARNDSVWTYAYRYGATVDYSKAPSVALGGGAVASPRVTLRNAADTLLRAASLGSGTTSASPLLALSDLRARLVDPLGDTTFYSLSKFGSPRKTYAPLIPSDSVEYDDATGLVTRTISPTGHEMVFSYYANGLLKTQADNTLGKLDSLWYSSKYGIVQAIKSTDGQQWFWYDTLKTGWPITKTAPTASGPFTMYYKDSRGRDSVIVDPAGHYVWYAYATSGLQNLTSTTAPNLQTTTYARNASGFVTSTTAPNLAKSTDSLDALNRRVWNAGQYGDTTRYSYDGMNQPTVLKDAKGQADTLKRNALGWITSHVYANGAVDSTHFDSAGNVVDAWSRAGRHVHYAYDALGRLVKRAGTQTADSLWYDPTGKWVTVQSSVGGTVLSTDTDSTNETLHRSYSATVRAPGVTWRLQRAFNSGDPGISSVELYKKVSGTDTRMAYSYYSYEATQKRLTSIQSTNDTTGYTYNGDNLVVSRSLSAGFGDTLTYTSSHDLATRGYTGASVVDGALRRWYRSDSLARLEWRGGPDTLFEAFAYDSAGRLRWWKHKTMRTGSTCVNNDSNYGYSCSGTLPAGLDSLSVTYDSVGNPRDLSAVTATGNRLTSFNGVAMTYDADGYMKTRVTASTTDTLAWDEFGRLMSVKRVGGATTTFTYDGMGRRISKTSAGTTVQYLWDGDQIIAELDGNGNIQKSYTYDDVDHPRSVTTGGQTYFFSTEPDGTVDGIIRRSDKNVGAQYAYTPWGELQSTAQPFDNVSNLRWKGLPYDAETGFYYMRARYYDPKIRRFILEDPIGFGGGINVYAFANGDPINGSDPSGLIISCLIGAPGCGGIPFCTGGSSIEDCLGIGEHGNGGHDGGAPPAPTGEGFGNDGSGTQSKQPTFTKKPRPKGAFYCIAASMWAPPDFDMKEIIAAGMEGGRTDAAAGLAAVGQNGKYDVQRTHDAAGNITFYPDYTDASNFAVGAYMYGTGVSRTSMVIIARTYAAAKSSNAGSPRQVEYWLKGYDTAAKHNDPMCGPN